MGMTIDEIEFALNSIKIVLEHTEKGYYPEQFKTHEECLKEVMDIAHKYQKIQAIAEKCNLKLLPKEAMNTFMKDVLEVLEDGKIY